MFDHFLTQLGLPGVYSVDHTMPNFIKIHSVILETGKISSQCVQFMHFVQ